ncbi:hypothetical protein PGTUg99_015649 [Puccinia graminis f. sp. tritici]|uniref:DUF659 domain-containing protein n=1 Tax=Puccinia graminis f. sp. tritici TaxID=56615 RepID=A0A5B0REV0_PUCGR|nr:hypothetical protein PGTUg99_015649 [Puccinia graminis f. sp. tritici]
MPPVVGENFGDIFVDYLDDMEILDALICITADNASSNSTLATRVEHRLGGIFFATTQLLGCMAHVINLAAHDGLKAFGCENIEVAGEQEVTLNRMDLNAIVNRPDGANVNLKTIISCIHGLATYVRGSPQRRETFQATIDFVNKQNTRRKPMWCAVPVPMPKAYSRGVGIA